MKYTLRLLLLCTIFLLTPIDSKAQGGAVVRGIEALYSVFRSAPKTIRTVNGISKTRQAYSSFTSAYMVSNDLVELYNPQTVKFTIDNTDATKNLLKSNFASDVYGSTSLNNVTSKEFERFYRTNEKIKKVYGHKNRFDARPNAPKVVSKKAYDAIYSYQVKNNIPLSSVYNGSESKYKITEAGFEQFYQSQEKISKRLNLHLRFCRSLEIDNSLVYLHREFNSTISTLKYDIFGPNNPMRFKVTSNPSPAFTNSETFLSSSYPRHRRDLSNFNFDAIESIIDSEVERIFAKIYSLETNLHFLGYLKPDKKIVKLKFEVDLIDELTFLQKRLKTSSDQFLNDFNLTTDIKNYDNLVKMTSDKVDDYSYKLNELIIDSSDDLLTQLKIMIEANDLKNTNFVFDKELRGIIDNDINQSKKYIQINDKYKKFSKESVIIKSGIQPEKPTELIKLFENSNVYVQENKKVGKVIQKLNTNLKRSYDANDVKLVLLSKHKNQSYFRNKKDLVIDSLKRIFPKKLLSVLANRNTKSVKRKIKKEFRENQGKSLFFLGHIEKGSFVSKVDTQYRIPLNELDELASKYNVSCFYGGCSTAYYDLPGTSDIINDLNFGVALSNALKSSKSYKDLITNLSNQPINAGISKVKIVLNEKSFANDKIEADLYVKVSGVWQKLVDIIIGVFKK